MVQEANVRTAQALIDNKEAILENWIASQLADQRIRGSLFDTDELRRESRAFQQALIAACASGNLDSIESTEYEPVKKLLTDISRDRERRGFTPFETAYSIFSFKDSWVLALQNPFRDELETLALQVIVVSKLIDSLGLVTFYEWAQRREEIVSRQSREILEISTPVVQMWEGVAVAPLIGTLDTRRAQQFTERLLEFIVATHSSIALVDITGVASIDTRTAQHLIEAIAAVRLLGAQVILTGVSPRIAQTLVQLRIGLEDITTRSSLAAGLRYALDSLNLQVVNRDRR